MQKEYAQIARKIGKVLGAREEAVASEPLPQRLAELLRRLSDKESRHGSFPLPVSMSPCPKPRVL